MEYSFLFHHLWIPNIAFILLRLQNFIAHSFFSPFIGYLWNNMCLFNVDADAVCGVRCCICHSSAKFTLILSIFQHHYISNIYCFCIYIAFKDDVHRSGELFELKFYISLLFSLLLIVSFL